MLARPIMRALGAVLACLAAAEWLGSAAGCNGGQLVSMPEPQRQDGAARQDVVSQVNGSQITAAEVEQLARAGQLSTRAALQRLQAERLLAQEAEQRGYAQQSWTARAARQALVQALLTEDVEVEQPSVEALERAYSTQHARFEQQEQRRCTHVLAALAPDANLQQAQAARVFIEQAIALLTTSSDRSATLAALRSESSRAFVVCVEDLPLVHAQAAFVPEFLQALCSVPEAGVVPDPVRTQFGYHAIVVTEIVPASSTPKAEAFNTLRAELGTTLHEQRVAALINELRKGTRIAYAQKIERLLASLELRE